MTEFKNGHYSNPSLGRMAVGWDTKYFPLFEQVKKSWNLPIRNFYKKIMGVQLKDDEKRQEIKINIKPISDMHIIYRFDEAFKDVDFEEYRKFKDFLYASENVLVYFENSELNYNNLKGLINYTTNRLSKFDLADLNRKILEIFYDGNKDVFGKYFSSGILYDNRCEIDLYIIPCAIFCEANNIDLQTFATIILAHELAHGYNHLGIDKDNYHWESFWDTDEHLAEGLAQYYTLEFLEKHFNKLPKGLETFEFLLENQSEAYKSYQYWEATPEKTYSAFIEARRSNVISNHDFLKLLAGAKSRIKGDRKLFFT